MTIEDFRKHIGQTIIVQSMHGSLAEVEVIHVGQSIVKIRHVATGIEQLLYSSPKLNSYIMHCVDDFILIEVWE